jgi:FkbM family methyltransferase
MQKDIMRLLPSPRKKLIIFDIGCYRGVFFKSILNQLTKNELNQCKVYLFDINKNVKFYIKDFLKLKHIFFNEVAVSNKIGKAKYHYNSFFEASGSSLSTIYKDDKLWVNSRKLILKFLFQKTKNYIHYKVPTITLDSLIEKKNIKSIDILKIDVDGSELDVLEGLKKSLKNNRIKILLTEINEINKKYNLKEKKVINFLKKNNFKLVKKNIMLTPSLFSNIKSGDYLFINTKLI